MKTWTIDSEGADLVATNAMKETVTALITAGLVDEDAALHWLDSHACVVIDKQSVMARLLAFLGRTMPTEDTMAVVVVGVERKPEPAPEPRKPRQWMVDASSADNLPKDARIGDVIEVREPGNFEDSPLVTPSWNILNRGHKLVFDGQKWRET